MKEGVLEPNRRRREGPRRSHVTLEVPRALWRAFWCLFALALVLAFVLGYRLGGLEIAAPAETPPLPARALADPPAASAGSEALAAHLREEDRPAEPDAGSPDADDGGARAEAGAALRLASGASVSRDAGVADAKAKATANATAGGIADATIRGSSAHPLAQTARSDGGSGATPRVLGFAIQLGSYPSEAEAQAFIEGHRAAFGALPIFVVPSSLRGRGTWFRVRIGLTESRAEAETLRAALPAPLAGQALVVNHP